VVVVTRKIVWRIKGDMKNYNYERFWCIVFLLHLIVCVNLYSKTCRSKIYFKTRMAQEYNFLENSRLRFFCDHADDNESIFDDSEASDIEAKRDFIFSASPFLIFGVKSDAFNRAFLIDDKDCLLVASDNISSKEGRDIRAEWLGLSDGTSLFLGSKLDQHIFGVRFDCEFPFKIVFPKFPLVEWKVALRTVYTNKKNSMKFKLNSASASEKDTIKNFFSSVAKRTLIDEVDRENAGLESIAAIIGGNYTSPKRSFNIYYYSGLEVPMSEYKNDLNLFYPYVGNNGHLGLVIGASIHAIENSSKPVSIGVFASFENHLYIYRTHKRTFDLYNKPWSRYLPALDTNFTGANKLVGEISTLPVRIHPCNTLDFSIGPMIRNYKYKYPLFIRAGYNIWATQEEYLELVDRTNRAIYDNFYSHGIKGSASGKTSSGSNIKTLAKDDGSQVTFKINDLDIESASRKSGYSQSLFLNLMTNSENFSLSFGGMFEFGHDHIPYRCGAWGGVGIYW
jgi:hypothetical protein